MKDDERYEVIDEKLMTQISLGGGRELLPLIDAETTGANDPTAKSDNATSNTIESINDFINSIVGNGTAARTKQIFVDDGFERYKQEHPHDPFPFGGWVLSEE